MAKQKTKKHQEALPLFILLCFTCVVIVLLYIGFNTIQKQATSPTTDAPIASAQSTMLAPAPHAPLQPGKHYTCRPTITVDTTDAPDLKNWMAKTVIPIMQNWYPLIGDRIAWPVYAPRCTFKVTLKNLKGNTQTITSYTSGDIIVNAEYARMHTDDIGMFIHAMTHTIQGYTSSDIPDWVREGIADWARYYLYKDSTIAKPTNNGSYTENSRDTAYFLNYINTKYDKGFIFKLNMYASLGTYTDILFEKSTHKTADQLWAEATK